MISFRFVDGRSRPRTIREVIMDVQRATAEATAAHPFDRAGQARDVTHVVDVSFAALPKKIEGGK